MFYGVLIMPRDVYRYVFTNLATLSEALATLDLALIAVESLHSEARARLDGRFVSDPERRSLVIDASTPVGQALNQIFTGYARLEFGEDAFRVERIDRAPAAGSTAGAAACP